MVASLGTRPVGLLVKIFPKLSETFILEEVLGLERLGVSLRLYTLAEPTDDVAHPDVARVQTRPCRVPGWREQPLVFLQRHLCLLLARPLAYGRELLRASRRGRCGLREFVRAGWLARQMQGDGVAHLHAHFISAPADVAATASGLSGLPFSISAHAKDIYLSDATDLRRRLRAARFTVTCTDFNCRTLQAVDPQATVHRMYHGVDAAVFHPRRRLAVSLVPLIVSVGRLRAKKGLDTLIEACAQLRDRGQPFRCEIVGYGEEQSRLAALITARDLDDHVTLAGKLTRDQVIARYARAALYVQPSRVAADGDRDGIPNVLLEAMAMGLPVLATRVSGIPELVHDRRNGLLVEPDAPAALAVAMSELLDDRALGERLGVAARATVTETFDNDHNLRLVCQLLATHHDTAFEPIRRAAA